MRVLTIKSYFKLLAGRNELNRGTVWHNFLTKVDVSCPFTFRYFFSAVTADERKCPIMTHDMNMRKRHSAMVVHYCDDGEFLPTTGLKCENLQHKPSPHFISLQFQMLNVCFSRTIVCYFNLHSCQQTEEEERWDKMLNEREETVQRRLEDQAKIKRNIYKSQTALFHSATRWRRMRLCFRRLQLRSTYKLGVNSMKCR